MNSSDIRNAFKDFFREKEHQIVPSSPMVIKNDPTLMFTNAGMNQFKDIFLGNSQPAKNRVANTQKCLRVSGKHNDLEEVGHDTYHHTMFEMLGNWSFGDYFKKEAIEWAFEFLVEVLGIPKNRLYATVFEGYEADDLSRDNESAEYWNSLLKPDQILNGSKKDNFWEMGDTGPCGPCSEIHIDLRSEEDRKEIQGQDLVNKDHPLVIEIWNLVFIHYNRLSSGKLELLTEKHIDTGMGFERLCMVVQGKTSNYDTDVFQPIIQEVAKLSGKTYGVNEEEDIAMRVISDHLRAVAFSIADAQLPSNNKAGYVIRRILRRAIRYGYSFLGQDQAFIYKLVPILSDNLGETFPELKAQSNLISKVIQEEEDTFLKTLATGIKLLENLITKTIDGKRTMVSGEAAFILYDTYGFPIDLTELILQESGLEVDKKEFAENMEIQKSRSRNAAVLDTEDWVELQKANNKEDFVGYDHIESKIKIVKYRKVNKQGKNYYHLVFNNTPFYAESGGQVGDTGIIESSDETIEIIDTQKENELIIHISKKLPLQPGKVFKAKVKLNKRRDTENNHSATHLLHKALRDILGSHVEQKGSLVNNEYLRFDFSHFEKLSEEQIEEIEKLVNSDIRANYSLEEFRSIALPEAIDMGALALFGEKYGNDVRVIKFGNSIELCGGTHVKSTGQIGLLKIISESSIAAGIRRIEAITGSAVENLVLLQQRQLNNISRILKGPKNIEKAVLDLSEENQKLRISLENHNKAQLKYLKKSLLNAKIKTINDFSYIIEKVPVSSPDELKDLAFQLRTEVKNLYCALGSNINGKAHLVIILSDNLVMDKELNASEIIRSISREIHGGGGGQPFLATAGGRNPDGIEKALNQAKTIFLDKVS
ncbi:MAG: alanine--tRNA ligase [Bacteroidales bacterium]|nr:alanine--tRNA ligase [Bacteroidales bacterium]